MSSLCLGNHKKFSTVDIAPEDWSSLQWKDWAEFSFCHGFGFGSFCLLICCQFFWLQSWKKLWCLEPKHRTLLFLKYPLNIFQNCTEPVTGLKASQSFLLPALFLEERAEHLICSELHFNEPYQWESTPQEHTFSIPGLVGMLIIPRTQLLPSSINVLFGLPVGHHCSEYVA